ncbi:MAG: MFS transporter [Treponema sp.]|nr:MFS transporter [Treponema sp.]
MKEQSPIGPARISVELWIFFAIVAFTGLATGMSDSVISNFFKDAYDVTAVQRGFLEFPRELPGVLCFLIIAIAAPMGDVRLAILAQVLAAIGAVVLGLFTPAFGIMAVFIFVHSLGQHMYMPLQDGIGLSIIGKQDVGKRMGQYSGIRTAFAMLASVLIFFGFRFGFFSFSTPLKMPFIIGAVGFVCVIILYMVLLKKYKVQGQPRKKQFQIIIRKKYILYYALAVLVGVHRQIMIVYGPWVLIEILSRGADTLAFLSIIGSFIGIFMLPMIGRLADRYGPKIILFSEGILFIFVYIAFGIYSNGFLTGRMALMGFPVMVVYGLYIFERLTMQMGIARTMYLKTIAIDAADITPTLSTGLSMDHVVSIVCAYLGGLVWFNFGPQYVFYIAAGISIFNVIVALLIKGPMIAPMTVKN